MFPIYILKKGVKLPETGIYYVVAKNGVFLHKETGIVEAMIKVGKISFLEQMEPWVTLRLPKLPPELVVRTLLFFRRMHQQHHSEAIVLLHYSKEAQEYLLWCPEQTVETALVDYDCSERFDGYQLVGTIHSHNGFSAFHSSIDHWDERDFDGIHITIGRNDQPYFTISCSVVVNNNRFLVKPGNIIIGIKEVDWKPKPRVTYRRIAVPRDGSEPFGSRLIDLMLDPGNSYRYEPVQIADTSKFYDMALPDNKDYRSVKFPRSWMEKIRKKAPVRVRKKGIAGHRAIQ